MNDDAELKNPLHIGTIEISHATAKTSGCSSANFVSFTRK